MEMKNIFVFKTNKQRYMVFTFFMLKATCILAKIQSKLKKNDKNLNRMFFLKHSVLYCLKNADSIRSSVSQWQQGNTVYINTFTLQRCCRGHVFAFDTKACYDGSFYGGLQRKLEAKVQWNLHPR